MNKQSTNKPFRKSGGLLKRVMSLFTALAIALSVSYGMLDVKVGAISENEFAQKIALLKTQFVQGEYWIDEQVDSSKIKLSHSSLVENGWFTALGTHNYSCGAGYGFNSKCGTLTINGSEVAYQCNGFAKLLGILIFGGNPQKSEGGWQTIAATTKLYAGDIVVYNTNWGQHKFLVQSYVDGNWSAISDDYLVSATTTA